jgi:hypothetical protein
MPAAGKTTNRSRVTVVPQVHNCLAPMVKSPLERGADPPAAARDGWAPLHEAREQECKEAENIPIAAIKGSGRELP